MAVIGFSVICLFLNKFGKDILFTVAIGSIIASNIYHIGNYPIQVGNFIFGLDSILYTLFLFCIIVMLVFYDEKSAKTLMYSSVASICFTAIIQFLASLATGGVQEGVVWGLVSFFVSAIATVIPILIITKLYKNLENKNLNLLANISINIIFASVVNSFMYYGTMALLSGGVSDNFGEILVGSYLGKLISLAFCVFSMAILTNSNKNRNSNGKNEII